MARKETWIYRCHLLAKGLSTLAFAAVVVSFPSYEVVVLLPFFTFPLTVAAAGKILLQPIAKSL